MIRKFLKFGRRTEDLLRGSLRLHDSSSTRERDAQRFWTRPPTPERGLWWHFRGSGPFEDDAKWLRIGQRHFEIFEQFARSAQLARPIRKIVEWGCGGGANAVHFGKEAAEFYGVDVSQPGLDECAIQMARETPTCRYVPVQVEVDRPEVVTKHIPNDCDVFLSTYVFEVFPSLDYGDRVLRVAKELLRPGGIALVQVKYQTDDWRTRPRRWGYSRGVANMTTYQIHEFWMRSEACGLTPIGVHLVPQPAEVPDERYAYFCLMNPNR